jgi:hypothetical protein
MCLVDPRSGRLGHEPILSDNRTTGAELTTGAPSCTRVSGCFRAASRPRRRPQRAKAQKGRCMAHGRITLTNAPHSVKRPDSPVVRFQCGPLCLGASACFACLASLEGELYGPPWNVLRSLPPLYKAVMVMHWPKNDEETSIWYDSWHSDDEVADRFPVLHSHSRRKKRAAW